MGEWRGYGECGLPPKKPNVYLADLADVQSYVAAYLRHVEVVLAPGGPGGDYCPFQGLPVHYFAEWRTIARGAHEETMRRLLFALDSCPQNEDPSSRPARNALEMALLDLWGKMLNRPVYSVIGVGNVPKACFYTIGISDVEEMLGSLDFGLRFTHYLKIKLNRNIDFGMKVLSHIKEVLDSRNIKDFKFVIDANADWDVETAEKYLHFLKTYQDLIYMVEQPFPVTITNEEYPKWRLLKDKYYEQGILICADESVSTSSGIKDIKQIANMVNIKLDKTGGIREALRTVEVARKENLVIWFGLMVCSSLSTRATATLLPLATFGGDLDGSLLILDESDLFQSNLIWDSTGNVTLSNHPGLGATLK
eukprot:TRINITY_DN22432_c0_g1_i2.p1 TRINITY_DN22432_c0_g1~~TRINITY_DN22432_c0_g1_i2.p1  ORF type:complete len:422 (-),score=74.35 TRINITY_DN22432_c0_g1_i2:57-1151(-)